MLRVSSHSIFTKIVPADTHTERNFVIEPLDLRNSSALAALARQTYEETYHGSIFTPELFEFKFGDHYIKEILPHELADKNILYLVCKDGSKLVGYAKVEFSPDDAYLDKLYVLHAYQGLGIGSKLLTRCFEESLARGHGSMRVTAFEFNRKAIRFYESFGFKLQGEHQRHIHVMTGEPTKEFYVELVCENLSPQLKSRSSVKKQH